MSVSIPKNRCILLVEYKACMAMGLASALREAEAIVLGTLEKVRAALDVIAREKISAAFLT